MNGCCALMLFLHCLYLLFCYLLSIPDCCGYVSSFVLHIHCFTHYRVLSLIYFHGLSVLRFGGGFTFNSSGN